MRNLMAKLVLSSALAALAGQNLAIAETTQSLDRNRLRTASAMRLAQSEVYVPQAKGRLSRSVLPLVGGAPSASGGNTGGAPPTMTCNWTNATSPDCYAATQQARPMAK
jgi:hypothetical protein